MLKPLGIVVLLAIALSLIACSTRITQNAGGNASVRITTSTAVQPASAVGNNPVASVSATTLETK